jgi:ferredoxin
MRRPARPVEAPTGPVGSAPRIGARDFGANREREGTRMKVVVDFDLCEANAVCMDVCPEVFKVDEDDMLHILIERPGQALRKKVEEAVRLCPKQAISIVED